MFSPIFSAKAMNYCGSTRPASTARQNMGKSETIIRKRQFELIYEETTDLIVQDSIHFGDRFIPRRNTTTENNSIENRKCENSETECKDIFQLRLMQGYWRTKKYEKFLQKMLTIEKNQILKLTDPRLKTTIEIFYKVNRRNVKIKRACQNSHELDWPCFPRLRPMAYADSTHDLPGFSSNFGPNILSWSSKGNIAASFYKDLVLWRPDTLNTLIYKMSVCFAIAYNPAGDVLAVSCNKSGWAALQLWDCSQQNFIFYMKEYTLMKQGDRIECIDWDSTGKYIVCGTIDGSVLIFQARSLKLIERLNEKNSKIHTVRISPKTNYIAVNDILGKTTIWCWNSYKLQVKINPKIIFNSSMDWHPWNGNDLAIASSSPAAIYIYNVPSKTILAYYKRRDNLLLIETLIFNKLSAELLVSCSIRNVEEHPQHEVLVLASLDQIVDVMKAHDDTISFLAWNPNSMQLATASDDDVLFIWNFFALKKGTNRCPKSSNNEKKQESDHKFNLLKYIR